MKIAKDCALENRCKQGRRAYIGVGLGSLSQVALP